jgi:hypothetical protein
MNVTTETGMAVVALVGLCYVVCVCVRGLVVSAEGLIVNGNGR